jgi:gamma-glutamylaminecyclotransferase
MCLIIHKPKGTKVPLEILETAASKNPDGYGITYLDSFATHRGMTCNSLKYLARTKRPYVLHFRFATVGSVSLDNCHPFDVKSNHYLLYSNGTVHGYGDATRSDTQEIAEDVLSKLPKKSWEKFLDLTPTRFAIIDKFTMDVERYGKWYKRDGVHYSKSDCFPVSTGKTKVAVYGTLKFGYGNHRLLDKAEFVGMGSTRDKYPLHVKGLPYLFERKGEGNNVEVEVYSVDNATLASLDQLEGHPSFYKRKLIDISMSDWTTQKAWVYFVQTEPFDEWLPSVRSYEGSHLSDYSEPYNNY